MKSLKINQTWNGHLIRDEQFGNHLIIVNYNNPSTDINTCLVKVVKCHEVNIYEITINDEFYILKFSRDLEREFKCLKYLHNQTDKNISSLIPQYFKMEFTGRISKWNAILTQKFNHTLSVNSVI